MLEEWAWQKSSLPEYSGKHLFCSAHSSSFRPQRLIWIFWTGLIPEQHMTNNIILTQIRLASWQVFFAFFSFVDAVKFFFLIYPIVTRNKNKEEYWLWITLKYTKALALKIHIDLSFVWLWWIDDKMKPKIDEWSSQMNTRGFHLSLNLQILVHFLARKYLRSNWTRNRHTPRRHDDIR